VTGPAAREDGRISGGGSRVNGFDEKRRTARDYVQPLAKAGVMRIVVTRRGVQIALGLIWLLDGVMQFQHYFYSQGFITGVLEPVAQGQPHWISRSILWAAHLAGRHLALFNTLFAVTQTAIGLGLLFRPTVKPALLLSFGWVLFVWWFGEGLGMILARTASPLTSAAGGAPGAVLVYGLIGLLVWPTNRPDRRSAADGGLLGDLGGLGVWTVLWVLGAALWLQAANRSPDAFSSAVSGMQGSAAHWLSSLQGSVASASSGDGLGIAIGVATVSLVVAFGVWTRFRTAALLLGIVVALGYWLIGQSMGGIQTLQATDPNAGLLFALLGLTLLPHGRPRPAAAPSGPMLETSGVKA
jgi:hypothetical protein